MDLATFYRQAKSLIDYNPTFVNAGTQTVTTARYLVIGTMVVVFIQGTFSILGSAQATFAVSMPTAIKHVGTSSQVPNGGFIGSLRGTSQVEGPAIYTLSLSAFKEISLSRSDGAVIAQGANGSISGVFIYENGE